MAHALLPQIAPARSQPALEVSGAEARHVADGGDARATPAGLRSSDRRPTAARRAGGPGRPRRRPPAPPLGRWAWRGRRRSSPPTSPARCPAERGEAELVGDARRKRAGDVARRAEQAGRAGHVEERFVEGERLAERGHALEDGEHPSADVGVGVVSGGEPPSRLAPAAARGPSAWRCARRRGALRTTPPGRPRAGRRRPRSRGFRAGGGRLAARRTRRTRPCRGEQWPEAGRYWESSSSSDALRPSCCRPSCCRCRRRRPSTRPSSRRRRLFFSRSHRRIRRSRRRCRSGRPRTSDTDRWRRQP